MTVAVRASAPPLVGFGLSTLRSGSPRSIVVIVCASVFPSNPGFSAAIGAVALPPKAPTLTAFWVAYRLPLSVRTTSPLGRSCEQKRQDDVKTTSPVAATAG